MQQAETTIPQPRLRGHLPFRQAVVYVLIDPRTDEIRYVGVTTKQTRIRLNEHCGAARRGDRSHAYAWLRQVLKAGLKPRVEVIETVPPGGDWQGAEKRWIAHYRQLGVRLANLTDGGDGVPGFKPTPEQRERLKKALTGRKFSKEARANMSKAAKIRGVPPELISYMAKNGSAWKGKKHTEAAKAAMGRAKKANGFIPWMKGKAHSPDSIEKLRAAKLDNPNITTKFKARAVVVNHVCYSSMSEAARALGVKQRDINYWIRRGRAFYADGVNPVVPPPGLIGRPPKVRSNDQASLSF